MPVHSLLVPLRFFHLLLPLPVTLEFELFARKVKACRCPVTQFCWETLEEALLADRGEGMVLTAETGPYQVLPAAEPWGRLVRVEEGIGGMSATHQAYDFLSLSIPRHSPRAWFCKVPSCSPALEIFTCLLSMSPFLF